MKWLDRIPASVLVAGSIFLGLAPFVPEPHIVQKLRLLRQGSLNTPLDIFDLFYHLLPLVLLGLKFLGNRKKIRKSL
jgi:hypothetical protein